MFFSILIPVYNTTEYLPECMDSVLSQTFTDFEVVLIDDGSAEECAKLCDDYEKSNACVRVIHKQNEGLMMTRRRGFKEAKGEYFICVDSDDKLHDSRALEKIRSLIKSSGCDLVIYNYVYGAGGGRAETVRTVFDHKSGHLFRGDSKKEVYEKLLTTNYMNNIWIKCPSRDIVDIDTDYSEWKDDICRAEDLFQSYPMLNNAKCIGYIKDPLYYYRWAPDSISNKYKFGFFYSFKCIFNREESYLKKWNLSKEITAKAKNRRIVRISEIICRCYFDCKKSGTVSEWKAFADKIGKDPFYVDIMDGTEKKQVLLYYRLLHSLIIKGRKRAAIRLIETVSYLSGKLKKKK